MRPFASALLACVCLLSTAAAAGHQLVQRDVYLMGTRALLATYAPDRQAATTILEAALRILESTESQLSTWRGDSAISELNRTPVGSPWRADPTLCGVFHDLYKWHDETAGAFDPTVGALAAAWRIHEGGRLPDRTAIEGARAVSGLHLLDFDRARCTLTRRADVRLDVGAFGKGDALDRVARDVAGGTWLIDLGGQVSVGGPLPDGKPWVVDIAHPLDRERPVMQVELRSGSLSTSGGSERDVYIGGQRVGHILDPRSGRPASFNGSVVVWHERGLVADVLSTALFVMGPEEGLRWAEARGITAAFLMAGGSGVQTAATSSFAERLNPTEPE